jgi:hypothetical protein
MTASPALALVIGVSTIVAGVTNAAPAVACSCLDMMAIDGGKPITDEQRASRQFAKAADIVRGKIVAMRSQAVAQPPGVYARMQIDETLKGNLSGAIDVYTGFGLGDCGIPGLFLASIGWDRQADVAVTRIDGVDGAYAVNMCDYARVLPQPKNEGSIK